MGYVHGNVRRWGLCGKMEAVKRKRLCRHETNDIKEAVLPASGCAWMVAGGDYMKRRWRGLEPNNTPP